MDIFPLADTRGVVAFIPLLEGRVSLFGLEMLDGLFSTLELLEGRALLFGLVAFDGLKPADAGLLVVPAICKPPCPFGFGLTAEASPPPECG